MTTEETLRNALDGVLFYVKGVEQWLPPLLETYHNAKAAGLTVPPIPNSRLETLKATSAQAERQVRRIQSLWQQLGHL